MADKNNEYDFLRDYPKVKKLEKKLEKERKKQEIKDKETVMHAFKLEKKLESKEAKEDKDRNVRVWHF